MRGKSLTRKDRHGEAGAAFVEFAISVLFVCSVLFISIQLLYIGYSQLTVQFVATEALRQSIIDADEVNHSSSMLTYAKDRAGEMGLAIQTSDVQICPVRNVSNKTCPSFDTGTSNELIAVRITYGVPVMFWGQMTVTGFAVGRNEPF